MSAERLDLLVDLVLDGEASAAERAELEGWMARDAAARERMAERQTWFQTLRRVPLRTPPEDVRDSVLAIIRATPQEHRAAAPRARWNLIRPSWGLAYGLAAALVAVTVGALALMGKIGARPGGPVSGTMSPVRYGTIADRGAVDLDGAAFRAETCIQDGYVFLRLWGRSSAPAEVTIDYVPEELHLESRPPAETRTMHTTAGRIGFTTRGETKLELSWRYLASAPSPISVKTRIGEKEEAMTLAVRSGAREMQRAP